MPNGYQISSECSGLVCKSSRACLKYQMFQTKVDSSKAQVAVPGMRRIASAISGQLSRSASRPKRPRNSQAARRPPEVEAGTEWVGSGVLMERIVSYRGMVCKAGPGRSNAQACQRPCTGGLVSRFPDYRAATACQPSAASGRVTGWPLATRSSRRRRRSGRPASSVRCQVMKLPPDTHSVGR